MVINPKDVQRISSHLVGLHKDLSTRPPSPKYPISSLPHFNRKAWGLQCGKVTVIAGRTSSGKSALSEGFALDLAENGVPTLFLSLEMDVASLTERAFCRTMQVDNYSLLTGQFKFQKEIQDKWKIFTESMAKLPLLITCEIGKTFKEVNQIVEALDPTPKAVFVDYIGAIAFKDRQSREMMNEYIRQFKELAIKKDFIGVLCSQINRQGAVAGEEPQLHQLKETGNLEETASVVFLIHNPYIMTHNEEDRGKATIVIAKNRNGRTGRHKVKFVPQYYRFEELDTVEPSNDSLFEDDSKKFLDTFGGKVVK